MIAKGAFRVSNDHIRVALGLPSQVELRLIQDPMDESCEVLMYGHHELQGLTKYHRQGTPILEASQDQIRIHWMEKTKRIVAGGWSDRSEEELQKIKNKVYPPLTDEDRVSGMSWYTPTAEDIRRSDLVRLEDLNQQIALLEKKMKAEDEKNE